MGNRVIIPRKLFDMIGMTHPNNRLLRNLLEEVIFNINDKFRAAKLPPIRHFHASRTFLVQQNLQAVAKTKNRNVKVKKVRIQARSVLFVNAAGSAREDDAFG